VVAVVDTGVDLTHPDLRGVLVPGYTTFDEPRPQDYQGHGTHVSGIIVGQGQGRPGVQGVAPGCRVMPIKVMGPRGREGRVENVVAGLLWAVAQGAKVINMSLGDEGTSPLLRDAIRYALERDVVLVAASGNFEEGRHSSTNTMNYPAAMPGVISVGATDNGDRLADFSFWGHWMSVTAPGVEIHSSIPAEGSEAGAYEYEQGTSMAAPFVAGVAALLRSRFPDWTARQVRQRLEQTAQDLGPGGFDEQFGHGRIDARRAVLGP
jgi:type VII secretion-associated serine protease mycosin